MSSAIDASGNPIPTSSVLMAASKHIGIRCHSENLEFLKCKKKDQNPEKCLEQGRQVTRCALGLLRDLHQRCTKEMDDYVGCLYYHTNEFDLCRKEQQEFEKKCSFE
ncbi:PREDICTED: NADH dehydrogenase [ubiquinone] 1 alpha subcomplex subunit 8-B-like [Lupinus angustifolius]|nr:PREDICTED: NADH dehydrogenase [ubiquinone] 1 alpha subcomplex subunit 8-B-like [Lupinus angustifolius]XP_019431476.1 PREDICTED: NADH dehydrogenase [ubiquinone] 1 alpha subcomplex subunit 8-B-like [Lupinus angustifolius]